MKTRRWPDKDQRCRSQCGWAGCPLLVPRQTCGGVVVICRAQAPCRPHGPTAPTLGLLHMGPFDVEVTFASTQINVVAIYPNALPPKTTASLSPGTRSTNMFVGNYLNSHFVAQQMGPSHAPYPCRPHHGHPCQNKKILLLCGTDCGSISSTQGATQSVNCLVWRCQEKFPQIVALR